MFPHCYSKWVVIRIILNCRDRLHVHGDIDATNSTNNLPPNRFNHPLVYIEGQNIFVVRQLNSLLFRHAQRYQHKPKVLESTWSYHLVFQGWMACVLITSCNFFESVFGYFGGDVAGNCTNLFFYKASHQYM